MNIVQSCRPYCVGGIILLLCGCSSVSRTRISESAIERPSAGTGSLSAVGAAPIGASVEGLDPATGTPATIRVLREYDSAAGHACRVYTVLTGSTETRHGLACYTDGNWQEAPPLIPAQASIPVSGPAR
jgi:hypothetical protein